MSTRLSVTANNLSNASTAGYKASRVLFSDYLSKMNGTPGTPGAPGTKTEAFTQDRATYHDLKQGALQSTGNPLDLALGADGYFSVLTADGVRLTRAGKFQRLANGTIADGDGNALLDRVGKPIVLNQQDQSISVASDGTVSTESGIVGEIGVVRVTNPYTLTSQGNRLFQAHDNTSQTAAGEVRQGVLEGSNVESMSEMTQLIQLQRDFQFNTNLVESEATRQQNAIDKTDQVQVTVAGQANATTVGQLQLATFQNENGLEAMGQNLFTETQSSGNAITGTGDSVGFGSVQQGFVEQSNVNVVTEITDLITAQRAYEMNSKVITASDEMLQTLSALK